MQMSECVVSSSTENPTATLQKKVQILPHSKHEISATEMQLSALTCQRVKYFQLKRSEIHQCLLKIFISYTKLTHNKWSHSSTEFQQFKHVISTNGTQYTAWPNV